RASSGVDFVVEEGAPVGFVECGEVLEGVPTGDDVSDARTDLAGIVDRLDVSGRNLAFEQRDIVYHGVTVDSDITGAVVQAPNGAMLARSENRVRQIVGICTAG